MARRKSMYMDEGTDSDDSAASDEHTSVRQAPSFVPSTTAHVQTEEEQTIERRAFGAGLGAQPESMDIESPPRAGLGATPVPKTAGPALSRTSGSGGFDPAALMRQMGWTGGGLGKDGSGIVDPIQVKMRPSRAGVAFGGKETPKAQAAEPEQVQEAPPKVWKRREKKPRVVYRTYDEILAQAADQPVPILDATGAEIQAASLSEALARHPVPTSAHESLPELRHNMSLLCDGTKEKLGKLARHAAGLGERMHILERSLATAHAQTSHYEQERSSLASVLETVAALQHASHACLSLSELVPAMEQVAALPRDTIQRYGLDEAMAGALVPALKHMTSQWDPLREPHAGTRELSLWIPMLLATSTEAERPMTPYESVMWNIWMPAARQALVNVWDVYDAAPAVAFIEAWRDLLPPFMLDNVFDQLLLPKLERAVQTWTPRADVPMHVFVLPWLTLSEARMASVVSETRRKWRSVLSAWHVSQGIPAHLEAWRGIYSTKEWDALLLERIVPSISRALRTQFRVDPSQQDMQVLEQVLAWAGVLRDSVLSRLLHVELGTPWLRVLHAWITQPDADLREIAAWYEFWRSWFPPPVARLPGLSHMFMQGLRHINAALDRGADRVHMPAPVVAALHSRTESAPAPTKPRHAPPTLEEVSFRHVIEERAVEADLFVRSLNTLEPATGMALLRISHHMDGKVGTTFYLDDDVIFVAPQKQRSAEGQRLEYEPVSLAELLERAAA